MTIERPVALDDGAQTILEQWGTNGPAMLCVHGMTSSRKSWERFALHYADRFRIFAYDQRGHGDSSGVEGPMTLRRSLGDLYNVMDAIGEKIDVLAGHSWGGAIAVLGGERFDVRRVVAVDPMIRQASTQWYDEFLGDLREIFALHGARRDAKVLDEYADWPEIDRNRKVHAVHSMTAAPIEGLRDENPPEAWDLRGDLTEYPKPLLLAMAQGGESIVAPADLAYLHERAGANVAIRVFDGQGHNLHRTDFERFTATLDEFLR
ncbi:MAG TPA: alpha/beta hydrolase [Candidatus Baltobacteraceae bacterium]